MFYWEISIIFFFPGKKKLKKKDVPFGFFKSTILHLKNFKNDLEKLKKAYM